MKLPLPLHRVRLPWPLPALLVWLLAWGAFLLLRAVAVGVAAPSTGAAMVAPTAAPWLAAWVAPSRAPIVAWIAALLVGIAPALAWRRASRWRRLILGAGFPLSALASGLAADVPGWAWLAPLALLALVYPVQAWRDAPLFPTPANALQGLAERVPLAAGARVLDAGCGLGHGLQALRRVWPEARLEGIERSWPLRLAAALRCRWARVRQGDMWRQSWAGVDLVYLFQRPESMARALAKARAEMVRGGWLASLEFEVPGCRATAVLRNGCAKPVWLYRIDGEATNGSMPTARGR